MDKLHYLADSVANTEQSNPPSSMMHVHVKEERCFPVLDAKKFDPH